MTDKDKIVKELEELIKKPGGNQAIRFVLNNLGALPWFGNFILCRQQLMGRSRIASI